MGGYTTVSHINSLNGQQYEKMHIFSPGNLSCVKTACTEVTPNAAQTAKEGKKGRIPAMCCHGYVNWAPASPTSSRTVGLNTGSCFPGKGNKPPFPIAPFPSGSLGPLELWYKYGPDGPKILLSELPGAALCSAIVNASIRDIFFWLPSPSR